MKKHNIKLLRYSTAAGALLAISGAANAIAIPGTILLDWAGDPLYDGDAILNHDGDIVYIDIDDNGSPDFVGYMSLGGTNSGALWFSTYGSSSSIGFIAMSSESSWSVNKFALNDLIGPNFSTYRYYGLIGGFSGGGGSTPPPPLGDYFDWDSGDHGYIGVGLGTQSSAKYGWVEMELGVNSQYAEFISCALESSPNHRILAGNAEAVPLLPIASAAGLGLVGLMAALKRRKKTTI